jgi:hypothetical protein
VVFILRSPHRGPKLGSLNQDPKSWFPNCGPQIVVPKIVVPKIGVLKSGSPYRGPQIGIPQIVVPKSWSLNQGPQIGVPKSGSPNSGPQNRDPQIGFLIGLPTVPLTMWLDLSARRQFITVN